jgi:NAD(P)-dependent dehydrogenase (short-subunit alcohol dehydrogenase family)
MSKAALSVRPTGSVTYENHNRIVLVTGGCNGIGRAICEGFASSGATVVCADIAEEFADQLPVGVAFRHVDTSVELQCREVVQWTVENFRGLDILVNNAAIQPKASYTSVDQLDVAEMERMTRVNFFGYTFMAKYALGQMRLQQSGVVVNLSSGQGHRTARQVPVYGPIKAANLLQAMQWGVEYARDGIRVVSVSPGAIDTPLVRASLAAQGGEAALANRHPLGRIGRPEEIANAVLWLTSGDASFVTATDLEVDGGLGAFGAFAEPYEK